MSNFASGRCAGDCRLVRAIVRDMSKAEDEELTAIQAAVTDLVGKFELRMGGDLVTALYRWSEAAARQQRRNTAQATVTPLAVKRVAS
jgi:putative NADH-flavin reductase